MSINYNFLNVFYQQLSKCSYIRYPDLGVPDWADVGNKTRVELVGVGMCMFVCVCLFGGDGGGRVHPFPTWQKMGACFPSVSRFFFLNDNNENVHAITFRSSDTSSCFIPSFYQSISGQWEEKVPSLEHRCLFSFADQTEALQRQNSEKKKE